MRIENPKLLKSYLRRGRCEWCGKHCSSLAACHVFSRGAGRIDHNLNLVGLGMDAVTDCTCHHDSHRTGMPSKTELLAVIAAREDAMQDDIESAIRIVRHLPKSPTMADVRKGLTLFSANSGTAKLVLRILDDSGVAL